MAVGFKIKRGPSIIYLEDGELYLNKDTKSVQIGCDSSLITLVPLNTEVTGDIIINGKFVGTSTHSIKADTAVSASIAAQSLIALHSITANEVTSDKYIKSDVDTQSIDGDLIINKDLNVKGTLITNQILNATKLNVEQNEINITAKGNQLPNASINIVSADTKKIVSGISYNINDEKWIIDKPLIANIEGTITHAKISELAETAKISQYSETAKTAEESKNAKYINNDNSNAFIDGGNFFETTARIGTKNDNDIIFILNNREKIIFNKDGNIGIGTTTPETPLHVNGNVKIEKDLYVAGTIHSNINGIANKAYTSDLAETANKSLYPLKVNGTSLYSVINGDYHVTENGNVFLGNQSGDKAIGTSNSVFIGNTTGYSAINAHSSIFIGYMAGYSAHKAEQSIFIGTEAGESAINASNSILIGNKAGKNTEENGIGDNNIIIGNNISLNEGESNTLNIGGAIFAKNIYSNKAGVPLKTSVDNAKIGINTSTPEYSLDVNGSVNISNVLKLTPLNQLPTDAQIGSLAISGSGDELNMYLYTGAGKTGWRKLFLYLPND